MFSATLPASEVRPASRVLIVAAHIPVSTMPTRAGGSRWMAMAAYAPSTGLASGMAATWSAIRSRAVIGGINQMNIPMRRRPAPSRAARRASRPSFAHMNRGQGPPLSALALMMLLAYQAR